MTNRTTLSTDDQYLLVYAGIAAVAAACDGAIDDDGVGFNGQDTKFGKRIASVPFEEWTADVKVEAARIAARYRKQIEASLGLDITTVPVVQEAQGHGTNTAARNTARGFENLGLKAERKARLIQGNVIAFSWHRKDPDCFGVLLDEVKRLPGRRWTGSVNEVALSVEALDFIERHDVAAEFDVETARTLLAAQAAAPQPEAKPDVYLDEKSGRVVVTFAFSQDALTSVRRLPGRDWNRTVRQANTCDLHPAVLEFADEFALTVDPAVVEAVNNIGANKAAAQTEADIRRSVSGLADPSALPAEFVQRVLAATDKAVVA